jgi:catechol 2,3-dioxygenase-like lactoylglutathione lyase family enzyme
MKATIHHIGVYTHDPVRLVEFYRTKLGFEHVATKSVGKELMSSVFKMPMPCTIDKLKFENVVLEVFSSKKGKFSGKPVDSLGVNHWGMNVEDKTYYVQELEEKGVPVIKFEGQGKWVFFVEDPDGNLIEIYEDKDRS